MLKILNQVGGTALLVILTVFLVAIPSNDVSAAVKQESKVEKINSIMTEITNLLNLVKDRREFAVNKDTLDQVDNSGRSEDFFLRVGEDSPFIVYATEPTSIVLETDGGVRQIVVTNSCSEEDSEVLMFSNSNCVEETWIIESEVKDGVKSFTIPVSLVTKQAEEVINLSVFACRFDGCVFEMDLNIPYKTEITFADQVEIYDRYEWEYEWEDNIYHVQEVLLNFPYKDIKKVDLRVRCDVSGLYIATTEDDRATCNNRRRFSNVDYRDYETDEVGNVYNLRIESVTRDIQIEDSGSVELEFKFTNKQNRVIHTLYYRPVQKDEIPEVEEETENE